MKSYSKTEIIRGIRNRNNRIVLWLYEQVLPGLEEYVSRKGGSVQDAKDLFQDAMMIVFDKIRRNKFKPEVSVSAYIFGACMKMWVSKFRKSIRNRNFEETEEKEKNLPANMYVDPEPPVDFSEIKRALYVRHVSSIGTECREILRLVNRGLSVEEISKILGHSDPRSTRNKKNYCMSKLIKRIRKDPDYPYPDQEE